MRHTWVAMEEERSPGAHREADLVDVVCLAGTGQNGATLLSRMLGHLPGIVAVGELGRLWDTGLLENRPCSCGVAFRDCPFWSQVGNDAFGGWDHVDGHAVARKREAVRLKRRIRPLPNAPVPELRKIGRAQLLPFLLFPRLWPEYRRNAGDYADDLHTLYRAIRDIAGRAVVLDSMKVPYHVFLLRDVPGIRLKVVHLVRDVRGVALSSLRSIPKQGAEGRYRGTRHPAKTGLRWSWVNLSSHLLRRMGTPVLTVRYEDVVRRPVEQLESIAKFAGLNLPAAGMSFIRGDEVDLPADHLVAGNRVRLESGAVRLRVDDEWRTKLSPRQQRLALLAARPLLRRYGYLGSGRSGGDSGMGDGTGSGSPSAIINP